jgi:hypothetical protein
MRRLALGAGAVGLVIWAALAAWPWFTRTRTPYTGTPSVTPYAKITPVRLRPRSRACLNQVALERTTRRVVINTPAMRATGPRLRITLSAPGYRGAATIPAGYGGLTGLIALIPGPPRSLLARVCVLNAGHRSVSLVGSAEQRTISRPTTTVDGHLIRTRLTMTLVENRDSSIRTRLGSVLRHAAAFKPFPFGRIGLILVVLLIVAGVPLGAGAALWDALRGD